MAKLDEKKFNDKKAANDKKAEEIKKKAKIVLGLEEPEVVAQPEPEAPVNKNPAVVAAYEKMLAAKKAKEEQKKKDAEAQNPARQQEIRAKLAEILKQKKEKESLERELDEKKA